MYKNITDIYSKDDFLGQIKEVTETYKERLKSAPVKGYKDKTFNKYVKSQWMVTEDWKGALRSIAEQAAVFGYDADSLGLHAKAIKASEEE